MSGLTKSIITYPHAKQKKRTVTQMTVAKSNKKKMSPDLIKKIGEGLLKKYVGSQIMVKALTDERWISLKSYSDNMDIILNEADYLNGRKQAEIPQIYKATFYILK
jgi:hypothetical protein